MNIRKLLPGVKTNISLAKYTTFRIGGKAKYFFEAKTKKDIIKAIKTARKLKLPFFVLAGGSNLLVSDKGFKGLVIKLQITNYKLQTNSEKQITNIYAEAGVLLEKLVRISAEKGLAGLEWATGIPGTIGGAIYGNAGSFGKSMKDVTKTVRVLEIKNRASITEGGKERIFFDYGSEGEEEDEVLFAIQNVKIKNLKNKECKFDYRNSIFKKKNNLIITSVELELKKGNKKEIKKKIKKILDYKKKAQALNYPSAGSIFKNPPGFFVGELIEKCGLKGKKIGQAQISEKHANFVVNLGRARAKDVINLIKLIKKKVKKKFGIILEEEIQIL